MSLRAKSWGGVIVNRGVLALGKWGGFKKIIFSA